MEIIPATTWGRVVKGNPSKMRFDAVNELTVHYTGSPSVGISKDQVPGYIKRIEAEHMSRPDENMSTLGYNFLIDEFGRVWEGRGYTYRNGANGTKSNDTSMSVCILVGVKDNALTTDVIDAVRWLRAHGSKKVGRELKVLGHRDHKATSCPGEAVYKMVQNGTFLQAPAATGAPVAPAVPTPVAPVVPTPTPAPTPVPSSACVTRTVKNGDKGECVKLAQKKLIEHGYEPGPIDGKFGSKTRAAVKYFQEVNKLKADGIVGPKETWPALMKKA